MKTVESIPQIQVPASVWEAFVSARNRATAAAKEAEACKLALGLPEKETLQSEFGAEFSAVVIDGNGRPVGKITCGFRKGFEVAPGYVLKMT